MPILRTLLFTLLVPGSVAGLVPALLARVEPDGWDLPLGRLGSVGWAPLLVGVAFYLWCAWDFAAHGRGTPAPADPPRSLVQRGLYRHSRNPMYVGVVLVVLGEALLWSSILVLLYALALFIGFHLRVVLHEEPVLSRSFGPAYDEYRARVPRWLRARRRSG